MNANSPLTTFALLTSLAAALAVHAADAPRQLRAGAAASNITPPLGAGIVGSGTSLPPSMHIHDELWARCLVLDNGVTRLAIVVCDNAHATQPVYDLAKELIAKETGLPADHVLISATHTHSGPSAMGEYAFTWGAPLDDYQKFVARRIADGVRRALNNLEPARIGWGAGSVPQHLFNRRWHVQPGTPLPNPVGGTDRVLMNPGVRNPKLVKPAGPVDPEVFFISVQSTSGRPLALLGNYSLHYVGGVGSFHISADYFGLFADRIQQLLGADRQDPPFVGMMSNGWCSYLPTPAQHELGGYETWHGTGLVEVDASTKIVTSLMELFNRIR